MFGQLLQSERLVEGGSHGRRPRLRLLRLVNTLLHFSHIEAGRAEAALEATDLAALTRDFAAAFRPAIERAGLAFDVDCEGLDEPVWVDRDMWEKVVLNLLSNALKFTFEGLIRVHLRPTAGGVTLSVRDTGVGIAAAELTPVFDRFHRVEGSRSRTHEGAGIGLAHRGQRHRHWLGNVAARVRDVRAGAPGTAASARWPGLGLVIVQNLVSMHGGSVSAGSDGLGTSSMFVIRLPFDDNVDAADRLALGMHELGCDAPVAYDGPSALALVDAFRPQLGLLDIVLPGMDGHELARRLRARPDVPSLRLAAVTGYGQKGDIDRALQAGFDEHLVKPGDFDKLATLLTRVDPWAPSSESATPRPTA